MTDNKKRQNNVKFRVLLFESLTTQGTRLFRRGERPLGRTGVSVRAPRPRVQTHLNPRTRPKVKVSSEVLDKGHGSKDTPPIDTSSKVHIQQGTHASPSGLVVHKCRNYMNWN